MNQRILRASLFYWYSYDMYILHNSIEENLLICEYLLEKTTGQDRFYCINNYITKHDIEWEKFTDICTDGAQCILRKIKGVVTCIMELSTSATKSHYLFQASINYKNKISSSLKTI